MLGCDHETTHARSDLEVHMSMAAAWAWLGLAILLEVSGTICMKLSDGFARLLPALAMVVLYLGSFAAMIVSLKRIELGVAYAVWAGAGTALIALVGIVAFGEAAGLMKFVAILLIIVGVVMLRLGEVA